MSFYYSIKDERLRIGAIVHANQPSIYKQLNRKSKKKRRRKDSNKGSSSLLIMREKATADERKCVGR